jgi:membrane dipeptidase
MLIVDAHEDLAWNYLTFGRDYMLSANETRNRERGSATPTHNGDTLLGWPDYQRGKVAVIFSSLFAAPIRRKEGDWDIQCYTDTSQAKFFYHAQLDVYRRVCERYPDRCQLIQVKNDLQAILEHWINQAEPHPIGLVLLMEGAEAIETPADIEIWWQSGVRILGPAWAGNRFCGGTREPGPLTPEGYALLDIMSTIGLILDISHMDEKATLQALESYPGRVVASHANVLGLLKGSESNRFLSDRVLQGLIERDGITGVIPYNLFLKSDWKKGDPRDCVGLVDLIEQIDYICQMAGSAKHVGLGSDFDGGFGVQSAPYEIDTIADLQKLITLLTSRGYKEEDIASILGMNWINFLLQTLPETI